MGVKNLWDILEPCKKKIPLHHLQNKRVCVDLSCWMVQLQCVNKSYCAHKEKVYLRGLFHRIRALIALNCKIIFVTDGAIPAIKISTYRRRLNSGINATQEDPTDLQNVTSLKRNMGSEFSCVIKEAKLLGSATGVSFLDGVEEAEAQCALLNSESLCDGCFSIDSDIFLFGARTVYREICLGEGGYVISYEMADIERELGFGRNSLIALALLLGGDYSPGVKGLRPYSACQIVKSAGDSTVLQQFAKEGLPSMKKPKKSKKQQQPLKCDSKTNVWVLETDTDVMAKLGNVHDSQKGSHLLEVMDAYLKPKCHSADSDAVYRALAEQPFQRARLQELCFRFFQWPPEITDEYILPKIAERDLRRFANLRTSSSCLGVKLPLDKMPVPCPVSEVIKPRKVEGRECFEVAWQNIDGLKNSIVPSDIIEIACPEKITDFEERKAMKKKKEIRKKPKETKSEEKLAELSLQLQDLVLDIERGSYSSGDASISVIPDKTRENDNTLNHHSFLDEPLNHHSFLDEPPTTKSDCYSVSCYPTGATEVIDLLSPSPLILSRRINRVKDHNIHVIDLSDSEIEMSPDHERKARELRLFLATLRD